MSQNIAKSIVLVSALAVAGGAAAFLEDASYSAGFGVSNSWMKGKGLLEEGLAKSYPQANVFAGMRCGNFGIELGYTFSKNKKKESTSPTNTVLLKELNVQFGLTGAFLGTSTTAGDAELDGNKKIEMKSKLQGFNLDVLGYMPVMDDNFEVFGLVGLGFKKAKFSGTYDSKAVSFKSKNKVTFRVGAGATYMVTDMVGVRGKALFETTSKARTKVVSLAGDEVTKQQNFKPFKDSYSLGLDLFVKF